MTTDTPEARFTSLYNRHYSEVLAYCVRRIGSAGAEDATAEVFTVAWRRIGDVEWDTARPWLYGIARNVVGNRARSLRRRRRLLERLNGIGGDRAEHPETIVMRNSDGAVAAAVRAMRSADREILLLHAWEDLKAPEIALALGISPAAAKQRLHRAKKRLAAGLEKSAAAAPVLPRSLEQRGRS